MGFKHVKLVVVVTKMLMVLGYVVGQDGSSQIVPAIITFGDSAVDVGNNDYLPTFLRANFAPYGRDFINHTATGRFCNGKLATDITAEALGFDSYPLPYLSPLAKGKNLLIGANFASAGAGFYHYTSELSGAIPLSKQLENYREYQTKLAAVAGSKKSKKILSEAVYLVSFGSSDFVMNYYVNPFLNKFQTVDKFSNTLIQTFNKFVVDLHSLGARRIGVTALPPLGCLPLARTLFGKGNETCVETINEDAKSFNGKMNATVASLSKQYPKLKLVLFDTYTPFLVLVTQPSKSGFTEARKGCCGTGLVETTSLMCNPISPGTCTNASTHVFWDSVHPTEAANQVLADSLVGQGFDLIG